MVKIKCNRVLRGLCILFHFSESRHLNFLANVNLSHRFPLFLTLSFSRTRKTNVLDMPFILAVK